MNWAKVADIRNVAMAAVLTMAGCGMTMPLPVVDQVDLQRYAGRWFEIARYENSFEEGCVGATADYALRDDGRVSVLNTCRESTLDGEVRRIEGSARPASESNSKLRVSFFWPFEGDYWVIMLDEEGYEYAVVGEPARNFLWILSRTPQLDQEVLDEILAALPDLGYDPDQLFYVDQYADADDAP